MHGLIIMAYRLQIEFKNKCKSKLIFVGFIVVTLISLIFHISPRACVGNDQIEHNEQTTLGTEQQTTDNELDLEQQLSRMLPHVQLDKDPEKRWEQLNYLLFESEYQFVLNPEIVYTILSLLLKLEEKGFQYVPKIIDQETMKVNKQYSLRSYLQRRRLLVKWDSSLVETLLQTYQMSSTNCIEPNIKRMADIVEATKLLPIYPTLMSNLKNQYKECWFRYMEALNSIWTILGVDSMKQLLDMMNKIETPPAGFLPNIQELNETKRSQELDKYTTSIAKYICDLELLRSPKRELMDYNLEYYQTIKEPCMSLAPVASQLATRINRIISQMVIGSIDLDYINPYHVKLFNLQKVCSIVATDKSFAQNTVAKCVKLCKTHTKPMTIDPNQSLASQVINSQTFQGPINTSIPRIPTLATMQQGPLYGSKISGITTFVGGLNQLPIPIPNIILPAGIPRVPEPGSVKGQAKKRKRYTRKKKDAVDATINENINNFDVPEEPDLREITNPDADPKSNFNPNLNDLIQTQPIGVVDVEQQGANPINIDQQELQNDNQFQNIDGQKSPEFWESFLNDFDPTDGLPDGDELIFSTLPSSIPSDLNSVQQHDKNTKHRKET